MADDDFTLPNGFNLLDMDPVNEWTSQGVMREHESRQPENQGHIDAPAGAFRGFQSQPQLPSWRDHLDQLTQGQAQTASYSHGGADALGNAYKDMPEPEGTAPRAGQGVHR